jgi:hypothetical protein
MHLTFCFLLAGLVMHDLCCQGEEQSEKTVHTADAITHCAAGFEPVAAVNGSAASSCCQCSPGMYKSKKDMSDCQPCEVEIARIRLRFTHRGETTPHCQFECVSGKWPPFCVNPFYVAAWAIVILGVSTGFVYSLQVIRTRHHLQEQERLAQLYQKTI